MASGANVGYDSDQESVGYNSDQEPVDFSELPNFGIEPGENDKEALQSPGMGLACLLDAECAEKRTNERMEEIAKEMQLFSLDQAEGTKLPFMDVEEKHTELQPPTIPFFTDCHHHLYSLDTLVWPLAGGKYSKLDFRLDGMKKHDIVEFFERQYVSKKKPKLLLQYLFHLMCIAKDTLLHETFRTITYMLDVNSMNVNIYGDIVLAIANLGGNVDKLGMKVSAHSSPVIPQSNNPSVEQEKHHGVFKENKILILKFLSAHLVKSRQYSASELDDLLKIFLAIALDPLIMDSGSSINISNGISQILSLYSSSQAFIERMLNLVKHITVYCDFHHHTVAYVCMTYILPTQKHGQMLRSSLAYLQAQISLQREKQNLILQYVLVEDVLELVVEQHHMFADETDSSLLLRVMMLLDVCIGDDPLQSDQRTKLEELCNVIEPTIKRRKGNIDDQSTLHLDHFTDRLMIKWRQKAKWPKVL